MDARKLPAKVGEPTKLAFRNGRGYRFSPNWSQNPAGGGLSPVQGKICTLTTLAFITYLLTALKGFEMSSLENLSPKKAQVST